MSESTRPNAFWQWWDEPAQWWQFYKPQSALFVVIVTAAIVTNIFLIIRWFA